MADTLENITLEPNTWTDLYAATGIDVGTAIKVQNLGVADVYLTVSASTPSLDLDRYNVVQRENGIFLRNDTGSSGAWAYCNSIGKINVSIIT